jgi:hypothetical protein
MRAVHRSPIYIASIRGHRMPGKWRCDQCENYSTMYIWRYLDTAGNDLHICPRCKDEVYDRSHGGGDAMCLAVQGGSWGSGRRRH